MRDLDGLAETGVRPWPIRRRLREGDEAFDAMQIGEVNAFAGLLGERENASFSADSASEARPAASNPSACTRQKYEWPTTRPAPDITSSAVRNASMFCSDGILSMRACARCMMATKRIAPRLCSWQ
jgi:hypothetical protein